MTAAEYRREVGTPGEYPFTRGIHAEMYRTRLWTMRQYAGYASAEETNGRFHYLLSQGITGLSVAFDLPTQLGLDSDHSLAAGEVGRVGVAIDTLQDMERLLEGLPLDQVSTSMTINSTACILLAMYLAVARKRGIEWGSLRGTVQNDVLKEYIARGTYVYPPRASLRITTDIFSFCRQQVPRWNTISVSGYHIREAGATAAQEVAFTLANGEAYATAALEAGQEVDDFACRVSFFFAAHSDFFEEVAKFRAARRVWARLMKERFRAQQPQSWKLRFHAQTAGSTLTAQSPANNVVRVTLQALAAILGGTQSLHTNAQDEALALPTEESARLALRTQQILAFETSVPEVADPLGGSWYVERLTRKVEKETESYLDRVRTMGGMVRAIERGFPQAEIQEAAYRQQKSVEAGESVVVGVNRFQDAADTPPVTLRIDPGLEKEQTARLERIRSERDAGRCEKQLDAVRSRARGQQNLMPAIVSAVEAQATVGEIAAVLGEVFGEHHESVVI